MLNYHEIIREVLFTERSTKVSESENVYTFRVDPRANKLQIKEAVEKSFKVKVEDVRTINMPTKKKLDRNRGIVGKTRKVKKAMVKLAKGDSIDFA